MDLNLVAQDLFDELKSRYSHLTLGDEQAMTTTDPQSARFFKFDWNNNPVSIAVDEDNLRLVYNKDLADSLEEEDQQSWYDFARTMREFAVTHNLGFKPQDIEKVELEQGDFEFLSQVNTVQESKMHGTPKTSYDKLDKTRMVIRHSKQVDETVPGARSRNIDCIFIENAQGERFRFPFNYLKGARAMMMHVAQGGNPYDEIGESIVAKVDEIRQLRNFNSYTMRKGLLDETTAPYVEAAKARIQETIKTLEQLSKANSYQTALENLNTQSHELSEDDINDMKKRFTKETFDDSIVGAFKFLPLSELKPSDDDEGAMGRTDIMKQASTAGRYAQYVDNWLQDPESKLILKKDDSYDALQNNLRSQQKEMDLKLMTILRDIATRFLSADPEDDAIVNFASDMESQISQAGELFAKPDPETKRLKGTAIKLANKYLTDMKRIKQDDAYKDEVRKSPEDIKAYKDIKGREIGKGKLAKAYKRKYKDESEQFEAWVDSQIEGMDIMFEDEEIVASEYQDAYKKKIDQLEVTEAPKKFPEGHYTHTPGALEVMPSQDKTMWADAGELPKKFNVTKMKIAIYDEGDDQDPYSYGNGGLLVYHNAGTWKMYTDDVTRVQIADYLGIPTKDIDFSEQGMQDEGFMHFDIEDDAVAQLIGKGAFKLEETATEEGVKEGGKRIYIPDPEIPMPRLLRVEYQPDVTKALRKAAGLPDSAYVYFDDADLVYGEKTVWPMCGVDDKCTFGDAVKALKKFAKANPFDGERHFKEDEGSLDQFRNLYRKSIGSDDAAVTLRELINVINDDSLWSDEFPQLKQFVDVSPHSGSKIVTAKKIPGNSDDEKIQSLVKAIDDDNWVNATAKHLMRSYTLGEDDMSTGTVTVGKKGQTRRATGIDDNPYDHNEGEDQTALVNAALWNMKDVYQTLMAGESLSEDDMFSYGDLVQYLEQADMPDHYSKFWDLVVDAINSAGGFKGQGDEIMVDKNIAPQIKTLYQQFKAATANIKGVKEAPTKKPEQESQELGDILRLSGLK